METLALLLGFSRMLIRTVAVLLDVCSVYESTDVVMETYVIGSQHYILIDVPYGLTALYE